MTVKPPSNVISTELSSLFRSFMQGNVIEYYDNKVGMEVDAVVNRGPRPIAASMEPCDIYDISM